MGNKLITDKGKNELLRLGFKSGNSSPFQYVALGTTGSKGAQGGRFIEVNKGNYQRAVTTVSDPENKEITITATFDETNNTEGSTVTEIALCNNADSVSEETFFMYSEVPEIVKEDNISLQYTIIISIE